MKHALVIRHVAFEDLGAWEPGLRTRGFHLHWHEAGVDAFAVGPAAPDLVVVLGGPISINDRAGYPWLDQELAFIAARVRADLPTIGICLGAQAIAAALGARVFAAAQKEIGFAPVTLTRAGERSCLAPLAHDPITLHWHGDTFELPPGASHLAYTEITRNQAFAIGPRVLGVQFHPEAGGPGFERWLIGHSAELAEAGIAPSALRAQSQAHGAGVARKAEAVLAAFLRQADLA